MEYRIVIENKILSKHVLGTLKNIEGVRVMPTKRESTLRDEIVGSIQEINLIRQGKAKGINARDMLAELNR